MFRNADGLGDPVEPSIAMGAGFRANADQAGISNARLVEGDWLSVDPPAGTVALVNHVTYLTREIVPFIERPERVGSRRVIITVNSPPPPSWQRVLFHLVHGEAEQVVPGHVELVGVLWGLGILPDVRVLPLHSARPIIPTPTREAAIAARVAGFGGDQWTFWPLEPELERRLRSVLETRFDELFIASPEGFVPRFITPGREILITWAPAARAGLADAKIAFRRQDRSIEHALRALTGPRHAAATASCQCAVASARKIRSAGREMRWR